LGHVSKDRAGEFARYATEPPRARRSPPHASAASRETRAPRPVPSTRLLRTRCSRPRARDRRARQCWICGKAGVRPTCATGIETTRVTLLPEPEGWLGGVGAQRLYRSPSCVGGTWGRSTRGPGTLRRTTVAVTTGRQRTSRPMRPGRPGRWTERTQCAALDHTHTRAARLRALSCVNGVGVRVSLGASKSPANQGLSPLWKRNLSSARQPSYEHRGCSHAGGGNDLTPFAWDRGRQRVGRCARACDQQLRRPFDPEREASIEPGGAVAAELTSVYPRETRDRDRSLHPRSCSARYCMSGPSGSPDARWSTSSERPDRSGADSCIDLGERAS
jgi:hypothetical protein